MNKVAIKVPFSYPANEEHTNYVIGWQFRSLHVQIESHIILSN